MSIIVQKYGGSSVADAEKIKKIAELIAETKKQGHDVAVVVSAMGKTTNQLIETSRQISDDPPKREMDMLLTAGERITMSLLCMALEKLGIKAVSLTGSQSGIITNDRHTDARVIEVRPFRVQDELAKGKVVVVGGFQGVSYKRDVTTLGRGGSDTSAVALAAALNAERCEIYSDVAGVYSADPSLIKDARHLPEISYQQMQEMSTSGAKVLNAQAVQFAKEANIAIYARSTFNPEGETIVRTFLPGTTSGVTAVVHESNIVRILLVYNNNEEINWLLNFLEDKQIAVKELNAVEVSNKNFDSKISFVLSFSNIYGWEKIEKILLEKFKEKIELDYNLSAVSIIGEGLNRDNSILLETINLLKNNDVNVLGITTTSYRISLHVKKENMIKAVEICHKHWIK